MGILGRLVPMQSIEDPRQNNILSGLKALPAMFRKINMILWTISSVVERLFDVEEVTGSNPVLSTII